MADNNHILHHGPQSNPGVTVIGAEGGLKSVMALVDKLAPLDNPVLLSGEPGVGKEVIATAIHQASSRSNGPLVKINCGALAETLVESEFFGHELDALDGTNRHRPGCFERAHGGTLLLDAVGDLSLFAQFQLLRVMQTRQIQRIGGTGSIPVDIRVIAATHRHLDTMVLQHRFRQDLWSRLNSSPLQIPPLRQRREDIMLLVRYFMQQKGQELGMGETPSVDEGACEQLTCYAWPGNVRELENMVERAMIQVRGRARAQEPVASPLVLGQPAAKNREENKCLFPCLVTMGCGARVRQSPGDEYFLSLDAVIARQIEKVLSLTSGKVNGPGGAAEILRIHPSTLRHRMEKLGIAYGRDRGV